jgi:hypothetical protein
MKSQPPLDVDHRSFDYFSSLVDPFDGISLDEPASRYNNGKKKVLLKVSSFLIFPLDSHLLGTSRQIQRVQLVHE